MEVSGEILRPWHVFAESLHNSSWHYDPNHIYISPIAQSIRAAWNISHRSKEKHFLHTKSYQQLRFDEAIDIIYKHQHPIDCSNTYYLISLGYDSGFGSEFHVESYGLALAMESNRTYVSAHIFRQHKQWQKNIPECKQLNDSLSCYFLPWSSCSSYIDNIHKRIPETAHINFNPRFVRSTNDETIHKYLIHNSSDRFIQLYMKYDQGLKNLVPYQLIPIVETLPVIFNFRYYWWRAISMAYLMRINQVTIHYLNQLRIPNVKRLNGYCVSMYVRHGDKNKEMKLVPFQKYANEAMKMWNNYLASKASHHLGINHKPTLVLGTETNYILDQAIEWTKQNNWDLLYNPLQRELFGNPYHKYAYLVMIANLVDLMSCDVQVCTMESNYCRVLDELRATIAVKPHIPYIDLSPHTCIHPPCGIKKSSSDEYKSFSW